MMKRQYLTVALVGVIGLRVPVENQGFFLVMLSLTAHGDTRNPRRTLLVSITA